MSNHREYRLWDKNYVVAQNRLFHVVGKTDDPHYEGFGLLDGEFGEFVLFEDDNVTVFSSGTGGIDVLEHEPIEDSITMLLEVQERE